MFLSFGLGYVGGWVSNRLYHQWGVQTHGITRTSLPAGPAIASVWRQGLENIPPHWIEGATHLLISIPPDGEGCPVFRRWAPYIQSSIQSSPIRGVYYLSSTGVYGDQNGALVSEETPPAPDTIKGQNRWTAEKQWLSLSPALPIFIFRFSAIYGPGRSMLNRLKSDSNQSLFKPGPLVSRIHVHDGTSAIVRAYECPNQQGIYNLADDLPAPTSDLARYGADLMGIPYDEPPIPPQRPRRRISNAKVKKQLGLMLRYPTYREGLQDCFLHF